MSTKLKRGEPVKNWLRINDILAALDSAGIQAQSDRGAIAGGRLRPRDSNAGGPLKVYAKEDSYSPGERVVVLPGNSAVTAGIFDEDAGEVVKAVAGIYCCQLSVEPIDVGGGVFHYRVPQWPGPDGDDPEGENTYWWLEALYPQTLTRCDENGDEKNTIVNAQDEPTP